MGCVDTMVVEMMAAVMCRVDMMVVDTEEVVDIEENAVEVSVTVEVTTRAIVVVVHYVVILGRHDPWRDNASDNI